MPNLGRNVRVFPINRCLIDIAGIRVGQNVIIKRRNDAETKPSTSHTRESSLAHDYPMYNMMPSNNRRRINNEMVPPPMIHMNMERAEYQHDAKFMNDSPPMYSMSLHHDQEPHQFKVEVSTEHILPHEYSDDMLYDEEYEDLAVLTAHSR